MRVPSSPIAVMVFFTVMLTAPIAGVVPAGAQCAMTGGSGHDHAAMQGNRAARPSGSEQKMRQSIDRMLSSERGRAVLVGALLDDRAFMEALVQRLAANPEWRTQALRQLSATAPPAASGNGSAAPPSGTQVVYACPMHADVTSSGPGDCPKCGMALVRKESRRE